MFPSTIDVGVSFVWIFEIDARAAIRRLIIRLCLFIFDLLSFKFLKLFFSISI